MVCVGAVGGGQQEGWLQGLLTQAEICQNFLEQEGTWWVTWFSLVPAWLCTRVTVHRGGGGVNTDSQAPPETFWGLGISIFNNLLQIILRQPTLYSSLRLETINADCRICFCVSQKPRVSWR